MLSQYTLDSIFLFMANTRLLSLGDHPIFSKLHISQNNEITIS